MIAERKADETPTALTRQQWAVLAVIGAMILLLQRSRCMVSACR